jgi:hypothetical protein
MHYEAVNGYLGDENYRYFGAAIAHPAAGNVSEFEVRRRNGRLDIRLPHRDHPDVTDEICWDPEDAESRARINLARPAGLGELVLDIIRRYYAREEGREEGHGHRAAATVPGGAWTRRRAAAR